MSCKTCRSMLHSYINHELNALEAAAVSKHLEVCADCSREAEEIKKLKAIASAVKIDKFQLDGLKENIMSAIRVTKKIRTMTYDIKVLGRVGTSLIACGMLVLLMNFTTLGSSLALQRQNLNFDAQDINQKISQPLTFISKGLTDLSSKIIDLNGITFRIEQKIRGGM